MVPVWEMVFDKYRYWSFIHSHFHLYLRHTTYDSIAISTFINEFVEMFPDPMLTCEKKEKERKRTLNCWIRIGFMIEFYYSKNFPIFRQKITKKKTFSCHKSRIKLSKIYRRTRRLLYFWWRKIYKLIRCKTFTIVGTSGKAVWLQSRNEKFFCWLES